MGPAGDWSVAAYELIGRNDLAEGFKSTATEFASHGYRSMKDFIVRLIPCGYSVN